METPGCALIITPHPDDAEIACGGVVANWIKHGATVHYVLCSDGSKGTEDPNMTPDHLREIRYQEQKDAACVLGVTNVIALKYLDGELEDTKEFRGLIVKAIRTLRPDVVISPDPHRRSFYFHRDHRITGLVTQDAVFPYARDRLHFPEHEAEGLNPHKVGTLLFYGAEEPDTFIDISATMDLKIEALKKHRSQIGDPEGDESTIWLRQWCKEVGEQAGYDYAESFRKVEFRT